MPKSMKLPLKVDKCINTLRILCASPKMLANWLKTVFSSKKKYYFPFGQPALLLPDSSPCPNSDFSPFHSISRIFELHLRRSYLPPGTQADDGSSLSSSSLAAGEEERGRGFTLRISGKSGKIQKCTGKCHSDRTKFPSVAIFSKPDVEPPGRVSSFACKRYNKFV